MIRTLYLSSLSNASDPSHVLQSDGLVFRLGHIVERVGDVFSHEFCAIVEFHASAQLDLERLVIDPLPSRRQLPGVVVGDGIAIDQRVPHMMADDHPDADIVEIRSHVFRRLIVGEPDRIVFLAGER